MALGDADLCRVVHQWIDGSYSLEGVYDVPEETRLALGYAHPGNNPSAHQQADMPGADPNVPEHWYAPSPQLLRTLLTAMDVSEFAQHIITLAYQSLHLTHPEWYDGVTFNAHLANYLRHIRLETANHQPKAMQRR